MQDLLALPESLILSIKGLGGEVISERIDTLLSNKTLLVIPNERRRFRKLSSFPDKEYKVRTVAILDYWSQTVLKPLHIFLARVLRKIEQDMTFNQGAFKDKLKDCKIYYSVDLTSATDRFPIDLIAHVLKGIFPESYINH